MIMRRTQKTLLVTATHLNNWTRDRIRSDEAKRETAERKALDALATELRGMLQGVMIVWEFLELARRRKRRLTIRRHYRRSQIDPISLDGEPLEQARQRFDASEFAAAFVAEYFSRLSGCTVEIELTQKGHKEQTFVTLRLHSQSVDLNHPSADEQDSLYHKQTVLVGQLHA